MSEKFDCGHAKDDKNTILAPRCRICHNESQKKSAQRRKKKVLTGLPTQRPPSIPR